MGIYEKFRKNTNYCDIFFNFCYFAAFFSRVKEGKCCFFRLESVIITETMTAPSGSNGRGGMKKGNK